MGKDRQNEALRKLLSERYRYGFRMGSPIELMRIRNYAQEEKIALPEQDEKLEREIAAAGMNIEGKVFAFGDEALECVSRVVEDIFRSGVNVIFWERLMDIREEEFGAWNITSERILRAVLNKSKPQYYYGKNMMTAGEKISEEKAVVQEILRVSEEETVVLTESLREKLPYIPASKIARVLSSSREFIYIEDETYFLTKRFVISEKDADEIRNCAELECEQYGYASLARLPIRNVLEENCELSETVAQMAIYNILFGGEYRLQGKILTKEKTIDLKTLLQAYCEGKKTCTIAELTAYAEKLTGEPNRQNVMGVLYQKMVRVDKENFAEDESVSFDVNAVDAILEEMIGEGFAPIKSVTTFALFPSCGVRWNHYLLESFCYRFSQKYRLALKNYNSKNAGIIAKKNVPLTYAEMLGEAAAKANIALTLETLEQYFFENGYTAKRKYTQMPEILSYAQKMREKG